MRAVVANPCQQVTEICHVYVEAHSDFLYPLQVKHLFYNPTVVSEWCIVFLRKDGFLRKSTIISRLVGFVSTVSSWG